MIMGGRVYFNSWVLKMTLVGISSISNQPNPTKKLRVLSIFARPLWRHWRWISDHPYKNNAIPILNEAAPVKTPPAMGIHGFLPFLGVITHILGGVKPSFFMGTWGPRVESRWLATPLSLA